MNKLTEITRRDLFDIIRDGFRVKELVDDDEKYELNTDERGCYIIHMHYYGRLREVDFLSRLYDLGKLPSTDYRYSTAKDDIIKHTVNNDDWEYCWVFSDPRFDLQQGSDDEHLLRLICEMLHPAVRCENKPWKEYLMKFNELLSADGYELYAAEGISGRDVYRFREKDVIEITSPEDRRYSSLQIIGEGSYALVLKYNDEFYQRTFALKRAKKELNSKELARFKREFEQMAKLHSPYVVEVYSYYDDKNEYTMEYMDQTLEKYVSKNNDTISVQERKSIILQLIKGYQYIHSKEIFHRDVSFKNVLIKEYDDVVMVKIADFGLVKIPESDLTSENTELKGCLNDPSLKVKGFGTYDLLDEIYALTLLFVYIMTGKTNFASIKNPDVRKFMNKGTDPDRAKRYQNLCELRSGAMECLNALYADH